MVDAKKNLASKEKNRWLEVKLYTRRQINLYRMFFADFSVNRFSYNFVWTICESLGDYRSIFIGKYCIPKKLDHLACNTIQG